MQGMATEVKLQQCANLNAAGKRPPVCSVIRAHLRGHACRKMATENQAKVFATDNILTTLMCMKSSKYSWDLIVTKHNGKIFIDRWA